MPFRKTETGIIHFVSDREGEWTDLVFLETLEPKYRLLELARFGAVYINDGRVLGEARIVVDDVVRIHSQPRRYKKVSAADLIVFENEDLVIVDKPAGIPSHPSLDNLNENILTYLRDVLGDHILPSHRLDVVTSGILVFAKNQSALIRFQKLLSEHKVQKIYKAFVDGEGPAIGFYEHFMEKTPYAPKTILDVRKPKTQLCQLRILDRRPLEETTELTVELITGRTHQIRAQLAFMGFPLVNDVLYGGRETDTDERIELRCIEIHFFWNESPIRLKLKRC